jgi:methylated-DNA-protein-cysteine methyltransferase-like protein
MTPFQERVYRVVSAIPSGTIASYGGVAALLGQPRAARAVGSALCDLPEESDVPWWRVVNRDGEISISCIHHGPRLQRVLLESEGVEFDESGRISWERFGWDGVEFSAEQPAEP